MANSQNTRPRSTVVANDEHSRGSHATVRAGVPMAAHENIEVNQDPQADKDTKQGEVDHRNDKIDRPGFDLGGSSGTTSAGRGLGLDADAKSGRKDWRLPRGKKL